MKSNGNRPVAVYVPQGFDAKKPARVVTMFHGHDWNVGDQLKSKGVLERVKQLEKSDPQTIFVFPQGTKPPFTGWNN